MNEVDEGVAKEAFEVPSAQVASAKAHYDDLKETADGQCFGITDLR